MGIIEKIQSKIELYRLEKKYARRSNRNTFTTGATYVDGEYVYNNNPSSGVLSASSTGSSSKSNGVNKRMSALMGRN